MNELVGILRHSEGRRKEMEKYIKQKEQVFAAALAAATANATPLPSPVSFYFWKVFSDICTNICSLASQIYHVNFREMEMA